MRERHDEIKTLGADIVAIGTGDERYAAAFVKEEQIPYLVLVDDDARAAQAASIETASWFRLLHPTHVEGDARDEQARLSRPQDRASESPSSAPRS